MSAFYRDDEGNPTFRPLPDEPAFHEHMDIAELEDVAGHISDDDLIRNVYGRLVYSLNWIKASLALRRMAGATGGQVVAGNFADDGLFQFMTVQAAANFRMLEMLRAYRTLTEIPEGWPISRLIPPPGVDPEEDEPPAEEPPRYIDF